MTHYRKCFCNPTLAGTERKASLSILRILSIQWCALSPFICAIFRGSGEWSDERGATKAFPSREANQRQLRLFFFFSIQVLSFFPFSFSPSSGYSQGPETPPSCTNASFSTVGNHSIMLMMWTLWECGDKSGWNPSASVPWFLIQWRNWLVFLDTLCLRALRAREDLKFKFMGKLIEMCVTIIYCDRKPEACLLLLRVSPSLEQSKSSRTDVRFSWSHTH